MASLTNGHTNGVNGHSDYPSHQRFADIPAVIDIPVRGEEGDEAVNLDLTELLDETDELCDLLENENAARNYWVTIALAYVKQNKVNIAIDILTKGLQALARGRAEDRLSVLVCLCWVCLWKCRHAPRVKPTQPVDDERTKDYWLHQATATLNDASRISPSYAPLSLARGTLNLLRASLQPSKLGSGSQERSERNETLKQAAKHFDEAMRASNGKNMLAVIGKAKAQYSMGMFAPALALYQQALERAPDMIDPDPRIGIGCCLWQLGHKEQAKAAWQRSLDLNEESKIANILLGLYYLDESSQYSRKDEAWKPIYTKAMQDHVTPAFKLDGMHALTCATFGQYFLLRRAWANTERLSRRAIEHTDVNAIASDGWYLLARKEHFEGDLVKAADYYSKADQARGGDERGYSPAKFGSAQLRAQAQDYDGAKFRLEKMVEKTKNIEAMTLLGVLHAEDVFSHQLSGSKEDKNAEVKKAIAMLEQVRIAWKDARKKIQPDQAVLLNLARLYEGDQPEKALACLQQVEQMSLDDISDDDLPEELDNEMDERRAKRELLNPQLLNNIGCFHFQAEKYPEAREDFQTALSACVKLGDRSEDNDHTDTDALVSTISYNLARTYEAENIDEEARNIYNGLLQRHPDYIDANVRLAYLSLKADFADGAEPIKQLIELDPSNLEVRSLYGWYINRAKKRTSALNEDQEQRHYKQTLQTYDKHDLYSLVGMGNLHLAVAREMPRDTDQHKERRSKMYMRAVEFFDKVLALDAQNAFAAQGMGIAVVEDKKDTPTAIQVFSRVRESVKEASVHINLGHVFTEVKQYSRAIENYELALAKSKDREPQILGYLGRVWLMRGRAEKKLEAYKTSLEFSRQALEAAPENIAARFNVAFVQIQLAQMANQLPDASRTLADVEDAATGLDEAIATFGEIAKGPNPPFPRGDIEQRANMGRNTMKKQLASAIDRQAEYEKKNASRFEEARRRREEEVKRRQEARQEEESRAEAERIKIREERERMQQEDRDMVEKRLEEDRARMAAEYTTDEETGERKKREKKPKKSKRKKKTDDSDLEDGSEVEGGKSRPRSGVTSATGSDGEARQKKKRRLERKGKTVANSKFKSADVVEESDEEEMQVQTTATRDENGTADEDGADSTVGLTPPPDDEPFPQPSRTAQRKKNARVLDDDEDEDQDDAGGVAIGEPGSSDHGGD